MKTIVVASDLSHRSDRALSRAASLAEAHGARLILVAIVDEDLPSDIADSQAEQSRAQLEAAFQGLNRTCEVDIVVVIGDPLQDIHRIADEAQADLLVLGLHRPRPMIDLFRETTMERLVRVSERPVLVVRDLGAGEYARVLAPIDFSPASEAAVNAATRLNPHAELTLFHAFHVPFKGFRGEVTGGEMKAYLAGVEAERARWLKTARMPEGAPEIELIESSVGQALARKIEEVKPDLIAIGAHGRATVAPGVIGGLTSELKRDPPCDMLIARRAFD